MIANRIVKGIKAEIRAYGFSGNNPYHFSSKYLSPCAIKIENGKIKNMIALGLNPVINRQNTSKIEAIELREAKKPLVVEKRPIKASAKVGKLINGDKNTLSKLPDHENSGAKPVRILLKKLPTSKFLANSSSRIVSGW